MTGAFRRFARQALQLLFAGLLASGLATAGAAAPPRTSEGVLPDGSPWRIDLPDRWNGIVLINLDYVGGPGDPRAVPRSQLLLEHGYALAGTARRRTMWDIKASTANFAAILEEFRHRYSPPKMTLAFGQSLGGHTALGAVELRPDLFDGGVAMCGAPAGVVGLMNSKADAFFVAKTLLAPDSDLPLVHLPEDPSSTRLAVWRELLAHAQATPQGRARIALAATLAQLPTWSSPQKPPPDPRDDEALEAGLYDSFAAGPLPLVGQYPGLRLLEQMAGGNFIFNIGVDYAAELRHLQGAKLVERLYRKAGLSLADDLASLARAKRYAPMPQAIEAVSYQIYGSRLRRPVITLHASGDPISPPATTSAFERELKSAGNADLVRQAYTNAAGHCPFSPGEILAVTERLVHRVDTGRWEIIDAASLNALALSAGDPTPHFIDYVAEPFVRPFGLRDAARLRSQSVQIEAR